MSPFPTILRLSSPSLSIHFSIILCPPLLLLSNWLAPVLQIGVMSLFCSLPPPPQCVAAAVRPRQNQVVPESWGRGLNPIYLHGGGREWQMKAEKLGTGASWGKLHTVKHAGNIRFEFHLITTTLVKEGKMPSDVATETWRQKREEGREGEELCSGIFQLIFTLQQLGMKTRDMNSVPEERRSQCFSETHKLRRRLEEETWIWRDR